MCFLTRADMLTKGFEFAYKHGLPLNPNPKRYRMTPKCCNVMFDKSFRGGQFRWAGSCTLPA